MDPNCHISTRCARAALSVFTTWVAHMRATCPRELQHERVQGGDNAHLTGYGEVLTWPEEAFPWLCTLLDGSLSQLHNAWAESQQCWTRGVAFDMEAAAAELRALLAAVLALLTSCPACRAHAVLRSAHRTWL